MKFHAFILTQALPSIIYAQSLQLHYDFRHTLEPERNPRNYAMMNFEYFKTLDSGNLFIKPGAFLFKIQSDFNGVNNNIGNLYLQVSHSFRCWKPKIFLHLEYSGGLGIAEPGSFGYYLSNGISLGASHLVAWKGGFYNLALSYRYNAFQKPSHDIMFSFYWWKGIWNYKMELSGDIEIWTQNKNHGDPDLMTLTGKRIMLFGQPQVWVNLNKKFSLGSKINLYYHVLTDMNILQVYPTAAVKYKI